MGNDNRVKIIHPFLIAVFPALSLYIHNVSELSISVLFFPATILFVLSLCIWSLCGWITGSYYRAGILFSLFWLWLFSYEPVRNMVFSVSDYKIYRHRYFIPIWLLSGLLGSVLILRIKSRFINATKILNVCAIGLILITTTPLLLISHKGQSVSSMDVKTPIQSLRKLPDIYYIILDAYAGQKGLMKYLNFDNSDFIRYLKDKGFFIAENSHSNYAWTRPSISSSLNMDYLPLDSTHSLEKPHLASNIIYSKYISANRVVALAQSLGYKYIDLSIWKNSYFNRGRYVNFESDVYDFASALLHMTILGKPLIENFIAAKAKRHSVETRFHALESTLTLPKRKPLFVYAHFMIPHEPFVFDKNGLEYPFIVKLFQKKSKELYLNQLQFTNKKIESFLNIIFRTFDSSSLPIIIIQGDHGPRDMLSDLDQGAYLRTSILNVYLLPENGKKDLYDSITPVNSFRVVFRYYFGMNFPLLEDKTYFQVRDHISSPLRLLTFDK
jgi:hypothetical protein